MLRLQLQRSPRHNEPSGADRAGVVWRMRRRRREWKGEILVVQPMKLGVGWQASEEPTEAGSLSVSACVPEHVSY